MIRRFFRRRPSWYEEAAAYLDGELRGPARAEFEQELARSAGLRAYVEDLRTTKQAIAALPPVQLPRAFTISVAQARAASRAPRLERRPAAAAGGGGWFGGTALVRSVAAFSVVAVAALAAVITVDLAGDNGQGPRQGMADQTVAASDQSTAAALSQDSAAFAEQAMSEVATVQTARVQGEPAQADADEAADQSVQSALAAPATEPEATIEPEAMAEQVEVDSGDEPAGGQAEMPEETPLPEPEGSDGISAAAPPAAGAVETPPGGTGDDADVEPALAEGPEEAAPAEGTVTDDPPADQGVIAEPEPDTPVAQPVEPADAATDELPATGGGLAHDPSLDADVDEEGDGPADGGDADMTAEVERADFATEQATLDDAAADQTAATAAETAPTAAPAEPDAAPSPATLLPDSDDGADILLIALEIALGALVGLSLVTLFVVIRRRA